MAINSVAAFKRAIAEPNTVIRVIEHWQPQLKGTTRKPTKVQGNGYWFQGPRFSDGKIERMWAPIPKASDLKFNDDGSVTFHPASQKTWTIVVETEQNANA